MPAAAARRDTDEEDASGRRVCTCTAVNCELNANLTAFFSSPEPPLRAVRHCSLPAARAPSVARARLLPRVESKRARARRRRARDRRARPRPTRARLPLAAPRSLFRESRHRRFFRASPSVRPPPLVHRRASATMVASRKRAQGRTRVVEPSAKQKKFNATVQDIRDRFEARADPSCKLSPKEKFDAAQRDLEKLVDAIGEFHGRKLHFRRILLPEDAEWNESGLKEEFNVIIGHFETDGIGLRGNLRKLRSDGKRLVSDVWDWFFVHIGDTPAAGRARAPSFVMGNMIPWPGRHDAGKIILKGVGTRERKLIEDLIVEALNACGTPERAGGFGRPAREWMAKHCPADMPAERALWPELDGDVHTKSVHMCLATSIGSTRWLTERFIRGMADLFVHFGGPAGTFDTLLAKFKEDGRLLEITPEMAAWFSERIKEGQQYWKVTGQSKNAPGVGTRGVKKRKKAARVKKLMETLSNRTAPEKAATRKKMLATLSKRTAPEKAASEKKRIETLSKKTAPEKAATKKKMLATLSKKVKLKRKLKRKRGEGAGPLVVLPLPDVIHRVQHYIVTGAKGDRRAVCDGTVLCAVCKTGKTSRWRTGENPEEKICQKCYLRDKVRTCWSHARVPLHRVPPHLSSSRRLTTTTSAPGAAPRTDRTGSSPGAS
ncbi:uncharacterized protein MICPUCDRAFT_69891 [Micromonas pusilla CCMP1545]|uniref:Predicted protein n=1 Tax=Micromonas pusilla (strain CCMP1545) TaxID=564608 RepID=C1N2P6_MICPC|nr:uncharacterized protein MICPUCDRAFT_69891 [Micromonas pusilla CCMP1545]EEH53622.1 predicted protein [Micromonas pusilla CCMP1545]|eukprot:XP_003061910.1 predicted protein [Micromonas pusilla CCMP1545]